MKKILSLLLITVASLLVFSACNHEHEFPGAKEAAKPKNPVNESVDITNNDDIVVDQTNFKEDIKAVEAWLYSVKKYKYADKGSIVLVKYNYVDEDGVRTTQNSEFNFKGQKENERWQFVRVVPDVVLFQTFEGLEGAVKTPIEIAGWLNAATEPAAVVDKQRFWEKREFSANNYAQLSANGSDADITIDTWLITPKTLIGENMLLSFDCKLGFFNGQTLTVYISETFSGSKADITTANWINVTDSFTFDESATGGYPNDWLTSGGHDLKTYLDKELYVAFKYSSVGETGKITTTVQLDNIRIGK